MAVARQEHRQPHREGFPVELLVEEDRERPDLPVVSRHEIEIAWVAFASMEEQAGLDLPELGLDDGGYRIQALQALCELLETVRVGEIDLRDDEGVGNRRLFQGLGLPEAVHGVHRRDDRLRREMMPDD